MRLSNLPMPPSANNLYPTVRVGRKFIRTKSAELRRFERDIATWALASATELRIVRTMCNTLAPGKALSVHAVFVFRAEAIFCKDGKPKRNDTSNRLKALHDVLADLLGVDDCWFWKGTFDKRAVSTPGMPEGCHVDFEVIDVPRPALTAVKSPAKLLPS